MTTYLGYDVLVDPTNSREEAADTFARLLSICDPGTGPARRKPRDRAPKIAKPYLWTAQGRPAIQALRDFLNTRQGRLVPFWIPTWRRELRLALPTSPADAGLTVENHGYTRFLFGETQALRHVAIAAPNWSLTIRRITDAREDGDREILTLDSALGTAFTTQALVGFLLFCRLDTDAPRLSYINDGVAESSLPYVTLPEETP